MVVVKRCQSNKDFFSFHILNIKKLLNLLPISKSVQTRIYNKNIYLIDLMRMKNRFSKMGKSLLGAMCLLSTCGITYSCSVDYDLDETMPSFLGGSNISLTPSSVYWVSKCDVSSFV